MKHFRVGNLQFALLWVLIRHSPVLPVSRHKGKHQAVGDNPWGGYCPLSRAEQDPVQVGEQGTASLTTPDLAFTCFSLKGTCRRVYPVESTRKWTAALLSHSFLVGFVLLVPVILSCCWAIVSRLSSSPSASLFFRFFGCVLPYLLGFILEILLKLDAVHADLETKQRVRAWLSVPKALAHFRYCLNPVLYAFLGATFKNSSRNQLWRKLLGCFFSDLHFKNILRIL